MMPATTTKLRCVVYTQKSADERLDREFKTLDVQRVAYVGSQRVEWRMPARDRHDGGAFQHSRRLTLPS